MSDELSLIENWLYATLSADSTLTDLLGVQPASIGGQGIFSDTAPEGAVYPAVVFKWLPRGNGDAYYNGARRMWTGTWYKVTVIDERADFEGLSAIVSRVDALLSLDNEVVVTGGKINQSIRLEPYQGAIYAGASQKFRERGALWSIIAQAV